VGVATPACWSKNRLVTSLIFISVCQGGIELKIDEVKVFYLKVPKILDIGDGSQDMCLIQVRSGEYVGWGEAEGSPISCIASMYAPFSHSGCHPVIDSVLGMPINATSDLIHISELVRRDSFYGLLQSDITISGVEIALWDLLGKVKGEPAWPMLGYKKSYPKLPYASVLFGETPQETLDKASKISNDGFVAVKFGWGPYGRGTAAADENHVHAAREGIGKDAHLLIDAGTVFGEDVDAAAARLPALESAGVLFFKEPFKPTALGAYGKLSKLSKKVKLAGGEGSHNPHQAFDLIDYDGVGFVQIDAGYVGGIHNSYRIVQYAELKSVQFVNHTFTSNLTLSSSLQGYMGLENHWLSEYPIEPSSLASDITINHIVVNSDGYIQAPGLGMQINEGAVRKYRVDVELTVSGKVLYDTPPV
jgi:L-alanine-DL-glutamate epimerase-like enolase superfamily enzyme